MLASATSASHPHFCTHFARIKKSPGDNTACLGTMGGGQEYCVHFFSSEEDMDLGQWEEDKRIVPICSGEQDVM